MNPELTRMRALLGSDTEVYRALQVQFNSIFQRLSSIFALSGLTITVAGFSGYRIVQAGYFSTITLVMGLILALSSIATSLYAISKVKWLSSYSGSFDDSFNDMISMRDTKTHLSVISFRLLSLGLTSYVLAICNYLIMVSIHPGLVK